METVYLAVLMQEWLAMENCVYTATQGTCSADFCTYVWMMRLSHNFDISCFSATP